MQGNCASGTITNLNRAPVELRRLMGALSGSPIPLKPFQCLLVTDANTLFVDDARGLWIDNLYVGVTHPRRLHSSIPASILSTEQQNLNSSRLELPAKLQSINIFITNVTVHGHGLQTFPGRVLSLTNTAAKISVLCQGVNKTSSANPQPTFRSCTVKLKAADGVSDCVAPSMHQHARPHALHLASSSSSCAMLSRLTLLSVQTPHLWSLREGSPLSWQLLAPTAPASTACSATSGSLAVASLISQEEGPSLVTTAISPTSLPIEASWKQVTTSTMLATCTRMTTGGMCIGKTQMTMTATTSFSTLPHTKLCLPMVQTMWSTTKPSGTACIYNAGPGTMPCQIVHKRPLQKGEHAGPLQVDETKHTQTQGGHMSTQRKTTLSRNGTVTGMVAPLINTMMTAVRSYGSKMMRLPMLQARST